MELVGKQLGHYRVRNVLGRGGMGDVYLAEDLAMPRNVAIKIVRGTAVSNSQESQNALRLFTREMKAIAILDHPHILSVIDFGEEVVAGVTITYLVMPYRPEGSLADWLLRQREQHIPPSTQTEIAQLIQQAASAIQHAHDHHILHLDVKSSNFLVRALAENPRVPDLLLADFGISRFTVATASATASQSVRGSPISMAPEHWVGKPVPASDQYALAVMAYQLLTDRLPFSGNAEGMMYHHFATQPLPPSRINPTLPTDLDAVILRALAKDPNQRFATVTAFAQAFQQATGVNSAAYRRTVAASHFSPPPPPGVSSQPFQPTAPAQINSLIAPPPPGVATTPGYGYTWPSSQSGPTDFPRPLAQPGKRPRALLLIALVIILILGSIGIITVVRNNQANTATANSAATANTQAQMTGTTLANAHATSIAQATVTTQVSPTVTAQGKQPARTSAGSFAAIAGNYSGTLSNSSGVSANMTLVIQQNRATLTGQITDYPPLAPAHGPINGTTGADPNEYAFIQFKWNATVQNGACGAVCVLDFRGYLYTDGSLGGTYTIEQDPESGTWTATK